MHALLLCWAFAVFITCGHCQDGGLIVFGPKKIHPKSEFTIVITNLLNQRVRLQATLENLENPSILRQVKSYNFERQTSEKLTFQVADIEKCDCYQLEVKSLDNTFSFVEHASLENDAKTAITLIETDKPVYSPGEKLRFRVLVVDINTKPVTNIETVDVTITDPDNRVLRTWPLARLHKGVFESDVQLSSSSNSGKWSLTVVVDGVEEHKYFEVLLDLPKFFVRASPLKPVLLEDTTISIMLETAYTFGHPVEGRYKAELFLDDPVGQPDHIAQGQINGRTSVHFHMKDQVRDQVYMDSGSDFTQATLMVEVQTTLSSEYWCFFYFAKQWRDNLRNRQLIWRLRQSSTPTTGRIYTPTHKTHSRRKTSRLSGST
ncbi:thioester-containing protein 1 allele S3 [Aedes albopictus]|uniref:Alpha-2-macroglobulin bait region domain-containing protein n=1 Tax=Aedes albopictus TaxID=7160 RepID=A0ABM1ZJB7_AEDAL